MWWVAFSSFLKPVFPCISAKAIPADVKTDFSSSVLQKEVWQYYSLFFFLKLVRLVSVSLQWSVGYQVDKYINNIQYLIVPCSLRLAQGRVEGWGMPTARAPEGKIKQNFNIRPLLCGCCKLRACSLLLISGKVVEKLTKTLSIEGGQKKVHLKWWNPSNHLYAIPD